MDLAALAKRDVAGEVFGPVVQAALVGSSGAEAGDRAELAVVPMRAP
jgi:hypothetical protein